MALGLAILVLIVLVTGCSEQALPTPVATQLPTGVVETGGQVEPEPGDLTVQDPPSDTEPYFPNIVASEWHGPGYWGNGDRPVREGRIEVKPDLWLLIWNYEYDTLYFAERGNMRRMLAGGVDNAEIELVTSEVMQFRWYPSASGFRGFPLRITYWVDMDEAVEDFLYWDCAIPIRFNYYVKCDDREPPTPRGNEILEVIADDTTVTVRYSPWSDDPPWTNPPEIITSFDRSTSTLNMLFLRCSVGGDAVEGIQQLGPKDLYRSLSLEQTEEGVWLSIQLTGPTKYTSLGASAGLCSTTFEFRSK
jgi:hypothetical protein